MRTCSSGERKKIPIEDFFAEATKMTVKIYAHFDDEVGTKPPYTMPFALARPEDVQFGSIKKALIDKYNGLFPPSFALNYQDLCFYNDDNCPIPDSSPVPSYAWEHNDFFLKPLPDHLQEKTADRAMELSQQRKGELSYYYAHDRKNRSLVSKPQPGPAPGAARAPSPPVVQPAERSASSVNNAAAGEALPKYTKPNARQSPFGTDISKYETITEYSWEDHDSEWVKVFVPLEGIGKIPSRNIQAKFGVRQFELLIEDYQGKNLRFACSKTHAEMDVAECKHVVRNNRVNLLIRKAKDKDIWFDLFKKRAIGDDDPP